jgi:hypothetical protein
MLASKEPSRTKRWNLHHPRGGCQLSFVGAVVLVLTFQSHDILARLICARSDERRRNSQFSPKWGSCQRILSSLENNMVGCLKRMQLLTENSLCGHEDACVSGMCWRCVTWPSSANRQEHEARLP